MASKFIPAAPISIMEILPEGRKSSSLLSFPLRILKQRDKGKKYRKRNQVWLGHHFEGRDSLDSTAIPRRSGVSEFKNGAEKEMSFATTTHEYFNRSLFQVPSILSLGLIAF